MAGKDKQDITSSKKRSIRNVPMSKKEKEGKSAGSKKRTGQKKSETDGQKKTSSTKYTKRPRHSKRADREKQPQRSDSYVPRWGIWTAAVISVVIVVFAISTLFTSATLTISPKTVTRTVQTSITATGDGNDDVPLQYQKLSRTITATTTVAATTSKDVQEQATGKITIKNNYSSESMPLVDRTRFRASTNDAIYRLLESVTVPGAQGGEPGTATVRVHADKPGSEYNIPAKTTFTVPGLKGEAGYEDVTAVAETAIDGGAMGTKKVIPEKVRQSAQRKLQARLSDRQDSVLHNDVPSSYILYPSAVSTSFSGVTQADNSQKDEATLSMTATVTGYALPKNMLGQIITADTLGKTEDTSTIQLMNVSGLSFRPTTVPGDGTSTLTGIINGEATFVWDVDVQSVTKDLAGTEKSDIKSILSEYPEIQRATAEIRPFWLSSFPQDKGDITVVVQNPSKSQGDPDYTQQAADDNTTERNDINTGSEDRSNTTTTATSSTGTESGE